MGDYETDGNEVWEDAEGTLMTPADAHGQEWWVFGVARPIPATTPKIIHPLRKIVDVDGNVLTNKLRYPADWRNR